MDILKMTSSIFAGNVGFFQIFFGSNPTYSDQYFVIKDYIWFESKTAT